MSKAREFFKKLFENDTTKRFAVTARDAVISMYYAVGTSVATTILQVTQDGRLPSGNELKISVSAGVIVGIQHIVRKFLTGNSSDNG